MDDKKITKEEMESVFAPRYPRYQASFFIGNGNKDNQICIRHEDWDEFKKDLTKVAEIKEKAEKKRREEEAVRVAELKKGLATPVAMPERLPAEAFAPPAVKPATGAPQVAQEPQGDKPDQETCPHQFIKFVESHTEKNPGRWFKSCKACNKFLGWQDAKPPTDSINKEKVK